MELYNDDDNPWCWIAVGEGFNQPPVVEGNTSISMTRFIPYMSKYLYNDDGTIILSMDYSVPKRLYVDKDKWSIGTAYRDSACIYEQY